LFSDSAPVNWLIPYPVSHDGLRLLTRSETYANPGIGILLFSAAFFNHAELAIARMRRMGLNTAD
jgi:hypothetical protein